MQGVTWKPKLGGHFLSPPAIDELQVMMVSSRVDLIAEDREAGAGQVHTDLMSAARLRPRLQNGKPASLREGQSASNLKARNGRRAGGMHGPLQPDG